MKPVLKQPAEQRLVPRKRHHAVADISWRQNAVFAAQTPRAPAVIGDRDNRCKVRDGTPQAIPRLTPPSPSFGLPGNMFLQPAKERRKTRASAQRDNPRSFDGISLVSSCRFCFQKEP